jgi:hypothetical protein
MMQRLFAQVSRFFFFSWSSSVEYTVF